jgi:hypothetical protein
MDELNVTPRDLEGMERLGLVSSFRGGKERYTRLSIYCRTGYNRPIVAVVEGMEVMAGWDPSPINSRRFAFKHVCVGTIDRALRWFDDSELTETLRAQVDGWQPKPLPPQAAPNLRLLGYTGPDRLTDAVAWLYRLTDESDAAIGKLLERDFGIGERTVRNTLKLERKGGAAPSVWLAPFLAALRYFDRHAWSAETIASTDVVPMTTAATSPARSAKGNTHAA